ncbi:MAG: hypothetical protein Q9175_000425 [Cornicularia normoerica]
MLQIGFSYPLCNIFAQLFIKFSILLFYRRVFTTQKKWVRWVTYGLMASSVGTAQSGGSNKRSHSSKGSKGSSVFRKFTGCYSHDNYNKQEDDNKIPLHNTSWPLEAPKAAAVDIEGAKSVPAATRVVDQDRGRREQLHPELQDPRVINEVYRGVIPGEMGMGEDGITVKNDLEYVHFSKQLSPDPSHVSERNVHHAP